MTGLLVLLAVVALASLAGAAHRVRDGRLRRVSPPRGTGGEGAGSGSDRADGADVRAALAGVGVGPGEARVTLVQFSSAFCAPCRATRRVLADVAAAVPGVRHVEVDAEAHLDAVRALGVARTPTTLVVDADGAVVHRAAGTPRKEQVLAAVGDVLATGAGGQPGGDR